MKQVIILLFMFYACGTTAQNFALDPTFHASFNVASGTRGVNTFASLNASKHIIGGTFTSYNSQTVSHCVMVDSNGTLIRNFPVDNTVWKVATTPDSNIIIAGAFVFYNGIPYNRIVKVDSTGNVVAGWTSSSIFNTIKDFCIQPDGKIVIVGDFSLTDSFQYVARLNADGSIDTSFNTWQGISISPSGTPIAMRVALQSTGKIVVTGYFNLFDKYTISGIVRLNNNGSYDPSYNTGTGSLIGTTATVINSLAQSGDTIYVGGNFNNFNGTNVGRIAKLLPDGTTDTAFATAIGPTGFSSSVTAINVLPNGRLIVGGAFTNYKGIPLKRLCLLNADGNVDFSFVNTGTSNGIDPTGANPTAIYVDALGRAYIGMSTFGGFPTFNSVTCDHLIRLTNGTNTLPLTWLGLTAKHKNDRTIVSWQTVNEINNHLFEIESSANGERFEKIGETSPGKPSGVNFYEFMDVQPLSAKNKIYYRIKQTDFDGQYTYSGTVSISAPGNGRSHIVFPNPFSDKIYVVSEEKSVIHISDMTGRIVVSTRIESGNNEITLPDHLQNGIYFITDSENGFVSKVIKQ